MACRHFRLAGCDDLLLRLSLSAILPFGRPDQGQTSGRFPVPGSSLNVSSMMSLACCELNAEALGIDAWRDMIAAVSHGFDGLGFRIVRMGHAFLAARNTGNARSKPDKGRNLSGSIQPPSEHYGGFSKHIHALAR